jgi:hypothetical protein
MSTRSSLAIAALLLLVGVLPANAQPPRQDVLWARTTAGQPLTLDGVLNEAAWNNAESITLRYARPGAIPGSGWKAEGLNPVSDSTTAVLKFLVVGNRLWMGAVVQDSSVGGSADFNVFDGFLMQIKDRTSTAHPAPPAEYFYSWWYPGDPSPLAPGKPPGFIGRWGTFPPGQVRTPAQIDAWDARTVVNGTTNDDATPDNGYTVEMMFNLTPMGYDVTDADGDVVMFNISVYDCDWRWPPTGRTSSTRTWWQGPWGNAPGYNTVRMYSRPSVTINSGPVPFVFPELTIRQGDLQPAPVIDGLLNDAVWALAPSFDIRYGDDAVRATYPSIGPYLAGQYQPPVNGGEAFVADPGDATVKYFFRGDKLYFGFDVRDAVVQYVQEFDRWDGFIVSINEKTLLEPQDNTMLGRRLSFQVGPTGAPIAEDYLTTLRDDLGGAELGLQLKPGTTVDTLGLSPDVGYTAELSIDLTKLGYPPGRGDGVVFLGVNLLDGDSFTPFTDSYGTRTWWFREYENTSGPVWAYMDPNQHVTGVGPAQTPTAFSVIGVQPNPVVRFATMRFAVPRTSEVLLQVYDVLGREIESRSLGRFDPGVQTAPVNAADWPAGVYLYRLRMTDPETGTSLASVSGKLMRLR